MENASRTEVLLPNDWVVSRVRSCGNEEILGNITARGPWQGERIELPAKVAGPALVFPIEFNDVLCFESSGGSVFQVHCHGDSSTAGVGQSFVFIEEGEAYSINGLSCCVIARPESVP